MKPGDELVDVIDEEGRTVGQVTRREMRARRLPHRCVYLLVFNARRHLFIHLRTPAKDINPSFWDVTVGGVLAAGEDFDEGARREAAEELGVAVQPERLFPFRYEDDRTVVQAVVYRAYHDGPFRLQAEEVVRGEWVDEEELARRISADPFCADGLAVLEAFRAWQGNGPFA